MGLISPKAFAFVGYSFVLILVSVVALIGLIAAFGTIAGVVLYVMLSLFIPVVAAYLAGYRGVQIAKIFVVLIVLGMFANAVIAPSLDTGMAIIKAVAILIGAAVISEKI